MIKTEIQIRFSDIDMLGHANNVSVYNFYDIGLREYFKVVMDYTEQDRREKALAKVKATANFFAPIHLDDKLEVTTAMTHIGNRSLTIFQEITDPATRQVKSSCETIFAGYDVVNERSCEIAPQWKEAIAKHDKLTYEK